MSSLTNIPINARSMNGLITISDGTAVIEDGNISTTGDLTVDNLLCNTFSTQNMLVNYMQILRDSNPTVNTALGFTVDIGLLVQNMIFNDITRLYQIWNDTATSAVFQVDVSNNFIDFGGTARFNSVLPTSTLTPTSNTQLITKVFADTTYGQLAVANTWTLTNTFSRGIIPRRFAGNGTDYQISNNAMANRQTGSVLNIGIGNESLAGDSNSLGWQYNTGSRNIALGHLALQVLDSGNDNVAIGYQALQNTGLSRVNGVGVTANRCIAIGNYSQRTSIFASDNITIGHNSFSNNVSGNGNVIIATNGGGGLNGKSGCVIIGRNSCPTASENSIISIGDNAMGGASGATLACIAIGESALYNARSSGSIAIGYRALFNLTTGFDCQAWGYQSGQNATTATYSQFIGRGADTTLQSVVNSVCMGYGAITVENFEFVIGGLASGGYPRLTLPNKNRINCCQFTGSVASYTINWRTNEYVVINSATTTNINLPQAIDATEIHVGACFNIVRNHLSTSNITITAFGSEKISWNGVLVSSFTINSWVHSISLVCIDNVTGNGEWTVRDYNDRVTLATDARRIAVTDQTTSGTTYNLNLTTNFTGYQDTNASTNLTYNPASQTLNLGPTNSATGILNAYKVESTLQQYYEANTLVTGATTLTYSALRSYIPFTMKTTAGYTITLFEVNAVNVGSIITFKRMGGSLQPLTLAQVSNQVCFQASTSIGTLSSFIIASAVQSGGRIVAVQSQDAGSGTFTNAANSSTINILTQPSGTLSIGGIINCNGNIRHITAYGTGLGGTGTYTVNTAIVSANTGQPYTSSVSYGWAIDYIQ